MSILSMTNRRARDIEVFTRADEVWIRQQNSDGSKSEEIVITADQFNQFIDWLKEARDEILQRAEESE